MRNIIVAALFMTGAASGFGPQRPALPAPAASASFEARETWCEQYAAWLVAQTPQQGPLPADVRPTQRFEVEFNSCKPDPREYERQTLAELAHANTRPS